MGWKQIGNRLYYYRSRREGSKVVSEYVGTVESGFSSAQFRELCRQKRLEEQQEEQAEREAVERNERLFTDWFDGIETVAHAVMLAAGFHLHRGQWRRRRNGGDAQIDRDGSTCANGDQAALEDDLG
jgi:hypothetical protein